MICNKKTGTFLYRTPKSWRLIFVFYLVFYAILAAFWAVLYIAFSEIFINQKTPVFADHDDSYVFGNKPLIRNPNIRILPSNFIAVDVGCKDCHGKSDIQGYGRVERILKRYKNGNTTETAILSGCQDDDYKNGTVCAYLYMNQIYGLRYQTYNEMKSLPTEMNEYLKAQIQTTENKDQIWVSCDGKRAIDKDMLNTADIKYVPKDQGFPNKYFPYSNKEQSNPRIVVKFTPTKGVLLNIRCRLWARNIDFDVEQGIGFTDFQLLVTDGHKEVRNYAVNTKKMKELSKRPHRKEKSISP